ncbi:MULTISPECIES: dihydrofolate reductase family protein [Rhodococcus]|uniref:Dihydrofolate reductase family protein n=1 Tax=Rhodococcus oxybenzonivorans TaxID=1990687 RepID=A0AAE5A4U9_9NOCA|nr:MULTISPECIES: dihydrofolate reductase family protein [Rhodococcus]MDV7245457.1 dihydrofolate reductase family protein [Rhodococcus oxybenzonivorans]MDV7263258.1 dihydrofolate reductase family protein [Rhodococcus oxybenzonivorans]MDV7276537.1 dihydrofolate reductase family protein [Rhodococcus oxybenzonivorans]MDV7336536.1 dihydrofolate reductase family protein [Rhodococcus oxybenzonivorans]MDV7346867.1 dihydrofolate reductase family protein [Rhodococcus oxybenzonivorans]
MSELSTPAVRRVIVQELTTLDGFVAGPSGELDFFEAVSDFGEVDRDNIDLLADVDLVLLGRNTYQMFVEYWPTAEGEVVAEVVNTLPKLVFSSTLGRAPWGSWEPAQVYDGNVIERVRQLLREPGGDVVVWGSITLAKSLLAADLVDEIQLRVVPVLLGRGQRLLDEDTGMHALTLLEAKGYESGIVTLRYRVVPATP